MASSIACSDQAPPSQQRWPRTWEDQEALLERQHQRLEAGLMELLELYRTCSCPSGAAESEAADNACRRLLWDLRLHLRLEERWLDAQGCLCAGHRAAHTEAFRTAWGGFTQSHGDHLLRQRWLMDLRAWLLSHVSGADATAYALAHANP